MRIRALRVADFAAVALDTRRWFDRSQPQTLQIATWFLYLNGFFALIDFLDSGSGGPLGYARGSKGAIGLLAGLIVIGAYVLGGFLMANERKIGYQLALVAAFSPFLLRFWLLNGSGASSFDKLKGASLLSFIFDVALCALLLHPQSRSHQRIWFK